MSSTLTTWEDYIEKNPNTTSEEAAEIKFSNPAEATKKMFNHFLEKLKEEVKEANEKVKEANEKVKEADEKAKVRDGLETLQDHGRKYTRCCTNMKSKDVRTQVLSINTSRFQFDLSDINIDVLVF